MPDSNKMHWPAGQQGAVSLSYDDGLPVHFELVAPALEAAGLHATFYIPVYDAVIRYRDHWRSMAARGHEIGNHSLFHPCVGGPERQWLDPVYDLRNYNTRRWLEEIAVANDVLYQIDGQPERTFGNTCYDNRIGPDGSSVPMEPLLPRFFTAARGSNTGAPVNLEAYNRFNLGTRDCDQMSFEAIKSEIEAVASAGGWIIYTLHGIDRSTHAIYNDAAEHARLIEWLGLNHERIWTVPIIEVVRHIDSIQKSR
jgi:peptidoglycan/xylan/chitin deacetylase (PgdA/CDA1 family)